MNIRELKHEVCKQEEGAKEVDVAQTGEIMRVLAKILGKNPVARKNFDAYIDRLSKK